MDSKSKELVEAFEKAQLAYEEAEKAMVARFEERCDHVIQFSSLTGEQLSNTLYRIIAPIPDCVERCYLLDKYRTSGHLLKRTYLTT
jgi:hypothetical protein